MKCASCEAQVPASFGHAIRKNECPACGSALMDEESMALVEELRSFILQTVKVREETADTLAMALFAAYEISGRDGATQGIPLTNRRPTKPQTRPVKTAETEEEESEDDGIVKASDLADYPPDEKERIIQERLLERGIKNAMIPSKVATRIAGGAQGAGRALSDRELADSPILEAQRLLRLQKQEENQMNNPSSMCKVISRVGDDK